MATEYDLITRYEGVYSKEEQERIIEGVNKLEEGGYLFDKQDNSYKQKVLSCQTNTLLVSIEAGITDGWQKFTGRNGLNIGINSFGESAPGKVVAKHFGLTAKNITEKINSRLKEN